MNFIDFNAHITKKKMNDYGGSEKKMTVLLDDGKQYLLKLPDPVRRGNRDVSYINNVISEYIGCRIFASVGIPVQNTILGTYTGQKQTKGLACACEDIRGQGEKLHEADKLVLSSGEDRKTLSFDSINALIREVDGIDADKTYAAYCDRFIVDALIGNTDRHNGNWGFLENEREVYLAPVYDCGSSMSPLLEENELTEKAALNEAQRVHSAITDENGKRLHYKEFLLNGTNIDIKRALLRIVPKINLTKIKEMIEEIPYISKKRKSFYNCLLAERYEKILLPALKKALGMGLIEVRWNAGIIQSLYDYYILPITKEEDGKVMFQIQDKTIEGIKTDNYFFIMETRTLSAYCTCCINLIKTNRNVAEFIAFVERLGIDVAACMEDVEREIAGFSDADEQTMQELEQTDPFGMD